jgi:hypothetical protein
MRKSLLIIAVLIFTGGLGARTLKPEPLPPVSPQAKPEQKPDAKAAPNVTGKWAMALEMSMGTGTPTLELKQEGEKVTGTYTGRYGTFPLEGRLKERAIEFTVTMSAEGQSVTLTFAGEIAADGQTMKGTAAMGELGDATWSAKREKAADKSF